jgi:hypothetical protein
MTNTELIEQAQQIVANAEESGTAIFSPEDSDIIRRANMAQESRSRSGINPLIEGVLVGIFGEKKIAEQRLAELREREIRVEQLLVKKAATEKQLVEFGNDINRLKKQQTNYETAGSADAVRNLFKSRCWTINQLNFDGHLKQAALEALTARIIGENFSVFVQSKESEVESSRQRLKALDAEIKKLTR